MKNWSTEKLSDLVVSARAMIQMSVHLNSMLACLQNGSIFQEVLLPFNPLVVFTFQIPFETGGIKTTYFMETPDLHDLIESQN